MVSTMYVCVIRVNTFVRTAERPGCLTGWACCLCPLTQWSLAGGAYIQPWYTTHHATCTCQWLSGVCTRYYMYMTSVASWPCSY